MAAQQDHFLLLQSEGQERIAPREAAGSFPNKGPTYTGIEPGIRTRPDRRHDLRCRLLGKEQAVPREAARVYHNTV